MYHYTANVSSDSKAPIKQPAIQSDIPIAYIFFSLGVGFKKLYIVFNPVSLKRNDHYFEGIQPPTSKNFVYSMISGGSSD